jgi:hypothetical protein
VDGDSNNMLNMINEEVQSIITGTRHCCAKASLMYCCISSSVSKDRDISDWIDDLFIANNAHSTTYCSCERSYG